MIETFITEKINAYIAGGMSVENAAQFAREELSAIYRKQHYSRDNAGAMRLTQPPESISFLAAMQKADAAIEEIINKKKSAPTENTRSVYHSFEAIKRTIAAGIAIKSFFAKGGDSDPASYTTDMRQIEAMWNNRERRFKAYVRGKYIVIDIDRKPGKPDGLKSFYKTFPRETLPAELQNLPESFPVYTSTPNNGYHLFFKYEGAELKLRELAPSVEIIETQITCPGSRKEEGEYILHGELDKAPTLYSFIIDAIEETKQKKETAKTGQTKRFTQSKKTLDVLADEAVLQGTGHHDRQVRFAFKASRCNYPATVALSYVKSRTDIFGNGRDTESTILSVYRDNRDNGAA